MIQPNILNIIHHVIEREHFVFNLWDTIFWGNDDDLYRLLGRTSSLVAIGFTFSWLAFYCSGGFILENNEIFQGYDNSHTLFLNQYLWNPLNLNIHMTPWHPFNPFYQRAVDINNPINPLHWANPRSPFNFNNKLHSLVTNPFSPIGRALTNPLDLRYLYIMNR
jgi:hypothetical protein